jgi:hypothetical protein
VSAEEVTPPSSAYAEPAIRGVALPTLRPLGTSFADWMGSPSFRGGLGIETALVAALWALAPRP